MEEKIQLLVEQVDRTISMYQWTVGVFISIILGAIAFFGVVQWRLTKDQEKKIKNEILRDYSKDIAEVLGPIILNSLNQISLSNSEDYESNIKLWKEYLLISRKYPFGSEVNTTIHDWKYFIVYNFIRRLERATDLGVYDDTRYFELEKVYENAKKIDAFPKLEELSSIIKPVEEERNIDGRGNYENIDKILNDYKSFIIECESL